MRRCLAVCAIAVGAVLVMTAPASAQIPALPNPSPVLDPVWGTDDIVLGQVGLPGPSYGGDFGYPICPEGSPDPYWSCHVGIRRAHCHTDKDYTTEYPSVVTRQCIVDLGVATGECTELYEQNGRYYGTTWHRRCEVRTKKRTVAECYENYDSTLYTAEGERGCTAGRVRYRCHFARDYFGDDEPETCKLER